jgi:hypothetical protein
MMMTDQWDLPALDDICYGKHHCEECQEYNHPAPCPCGFTDYPADWREGRW